MSDTTSDLGILALTAQIVTAHVANNSVTEESLPALIRSVHAALVGTGTPASSPDTPRQEPAVPVKRSVFPDYLVCLEDGKKLKTMKRHLASAFGLTPAAYREKWGLPSDYPMVAPNSTKARSRRAIAIGFGRRKDAHPAVAPEPAKRSGKPAR